MMIDVFLCQDNQEEDEDDSLVEKVYKDSSTFLKVHVHKGLHI